VDLIVSLHEMIVKRLQRLSARMNSDLLQMPSVLGKGLSVTVRGVLHSLQGRIVVQQSCLLCGGRFSLLVLGLLQGGSVTV
jgi:hypothetical protein